MAQISDADARHSCRGCASTSIRSDGDHPISRQYWQKGLFNMMVAAIVHCTCISHERSVKEAATHDSINDRNRRHRGAESVLVAYR
jgi:hypothetical protein